MALRKVPLSIVFNKMVILKQVGYWQGNGALEICRVGEHMLLASMMLSRNLFVLRTDARVLQLYSTQRNFF